MASTNYAKSLEHPDETRPFQAHGHLDLVSFKDGSTVGKAVFEPGWRWARDVKPLAGTASCKTAHLGACIQGHMVIQMDNGDRFDIRAGDAFDIPPGHDAWVEGSEPCVMFDVGDKHYAERK